MKAPFPIVLILLCIWSSYHLALLKGFSLPVWVNSYADDVLFIPLVMGFALWLQRKWIKPNPHFVFSKRIIVVVWMYATIVFEIMFPMFNSSFTTDWLDSLGYLAGALFFGIVMNKPIQNTH
jgi:hypothetical protein